MSESAKQRATGRHQREQEARQVVDDIQLDRKRRDGRIGLGLLIAAVVLAVAAQWLFTALKPTETAIVAAPDPALAENRTWTGTLTLNHDVTLEIEITGDTAPQAAANFIALSQSHFYDNTPCHRLTTEGIYVLQCGDPTGTGSGGPGYQFGPLENVPKDGIYRTGTIAMARAQAPDSMGSQFFIVYEDSPLPAPGYTVFGRVTGGMDQLQTKIVDSGVEQGIASPTDGPPAQPVTITGIELQ
ncbi:peptidylprolyl isomerase [Gulosibacter hominis]|uniref:peptidylprolyl isomerase n=1 Tax=Gulosibacter hominis TaxID=2770504 RepID=UPI00191A4D6E|nr:peptidylprolyl isomerase [Gulosibacter hominis]